MADRSSFDVGQGTLFMWEIIFGVSLQVGMPRYIWQYQCSKRSSITSKHAGNVLLGEGGQISIPQAILWIVSHLWRVTYWKQCAAESTQYSDRIVAPHQLFVATETQVCLNWRTDACQGNDPLVVVYPPTILFCPAWAIRLTPQLTPAENEGHASSHRQEQENVSPDCHFNELVESYSAQYRRLVSSYRG